MIKDVLAKRMCFELFDTMKRLGLFERFEIDEKVSFDRDDVVENLEFMNAGDNNLIFIKGCSNVLIEDIEFILVIVVEENRVVYAVLNGDYKVVEDHVVVRNDIENFL